MILFILEIPLVAPSLNKWYAGIHWAQRKKVVDQWHKEVWIACKQDKVPKIKVPVDICTQTSFKTNRKSDTSNRFTANKLIEDGLVACGILVDDGPAYVHSHKILLPIFGHCDKTVVWITEAE